MDAKYIYCKNIQIGVLEEDALYVEFQQTKPVFGPDGIDGEEVTDACGITMSKEALEYFYQVATLILNGKVGDAK